MKKALQRPFSILCAVGLKLGQFGLEPQVFPDQPGHLAPGDVRVFFHPIILPSVQAQARRGGHGLVRVVVIRGAVHGDAAYGLRI